MRDDLEQGELILSLEWQAVNEKHHQIVGDFLLSEISLKPSCTCVHYVADGLWWRGCSRCTRFWEPESRTVTLIDWGGVGQLATCPQSTEFGKGREQGVAASKDDDTHCKLANLYSHMGSLVKAP